MKTTITAIVGFILLISHVQAESNQPTQQDPSTISMVLTEQQAWTLHFQTGSVLYSFDEFWSCPVAIQEDAYFTNLRLIHPTLEKVWHEESRIKKFSLLTQYEIPLEYDTQFFSYGDLMDIKFRIDDTLFMKDYKEGQINSVFLGLSWELSPDLDLNLGYQASMSDLEPFSGSVAALTWRF